MGVKLTALLPRHPITLEQLAGKVIAIDAYNHLYQFLSSIRTPNGELLTDGNGRVTSHLIGLFSRTAQLMQKNVKAVYVFDGKPPALKKATTEKRRAAKEAARSAYERATATDDVDGMRKYASRTSRLTSEMVDDAKRLLECLGIPVVNAPSEAEAQAAAMVERGDAYAVASQDVDAFLFGAPRLLRNLSLNGKRKKAGTLHYAEVDIELVQLNELLERLHISRKQLIMLAMLIGTDYAPDGVKGLGPAKALKEVIKHGEDMHTLFAAAAWEKHQQTDWNDVYETITHMPVSDDYALSWEKTDKDALVHFLAGERGFSEESVRKTADAIIKQQGGNAQQELGAFM